LGNILHNTKEALSK